MTDVKDAHSIPPPPVRISSFNSSFWVCYSIRPTWKLQKQHCEKAGKPFLPLRQVKIKICGHGRSALRVM